MFDDKKVALVLSGGGARGAFEAGVIDQLHQAGVRPEIVSGTSSGAVNAAAMAMGYDSSALCHLWSELRSRDVYRLRRDVQNLVKPTQLLGHPLRLAGIGDHSLGTHLLESMGWTWMYETSPLRNKLCEIAGGDTLDVVDDLTIIVAAIEARSGRLERFVNRLPKPERNHNRFVEVKMGIDHVMASAAIPLLFEPVRMLGGLYWDGGLVANTPLSAAIDYEPDIAIVVATGAVNRVHDEPETLNEAISIVIDDLVRHALVKDIGHAELVNKLVRAAPGATYHKAIDFIVVEPTMHAVGVSDLLDFEPRKSVALIEDGRRACEQALTEFEVWTDDR